MSEFYYESIFEFFLQDDIKVRVWRHEPSGDLVEFEDLNDAIAALNGSSTTLGRREVADVLIALPRVNAVEVKVHGTGIVVYREGP